MEFSVDVQAAAVLNNLNNAPKKIAYAVVFAINDTAKLIQDEHRKNARRSFKLRPSKGQFVLRQASILKPRAQVGSVFAGKAGPVVAPAYFAKLAVGDRPRLLLPEYERGGVRTSFRKASKNVAIPLPGGARVSPRSDVSPELLVKNLKLKQKHPKRGKRAKPIRASVALSKKRNLVGLHGTFAVPDVGIFQRIQKRVRLLYAFKRSVKIPARLGFIPTAERVARASFKFMLGKQIFGAIGHSLR